MHAVTPRWWSAKLRCRLCREIRGVGFRRRLLLSITFDHCIVTGGEAGRFLKAMIDGLEKLP
jgi:pyruvate/2-oxoglutarate dehydrogenase complex dihydrolipoamide acyltransferase (E2) component